MDAPQLTLVLTIGSQTFCRLPMSPQPWSFAPPEPNSLNPFEPEIMKWVYPAKEEYTLSLEDSQGKKIPFIAYVNDEQLKSDFHEPIKTDCLFRDAIGLVQFRAEPKEKDLPAVVWSSRPLLLHVKTSDPRLAELERMAAQVSRECGELLYPEEDRQWDSRPGAGSLSGRVQLLRDALAAFRQEAGRFRRDPRRVLRDQDMMGPFERIHRATPHTLRYVAQHPEELELSPAGGIPIDWLDGRTFSPRRTLITRPDFSATVYENQVVMDLLHTFLDGAKALEAQAGILLSSAPDPGRAPDKGFVSSYHILNAGIRPRLEQEVRALRALRGGLGDLLRLYREIFLLASRPLGRMPHPTAVLLKLPHYRRIFQLGELWFRHEGCDLREERFLLSISNSAVLYERYALLRLIHGLRDQGWQAVSKQREEFADGKPGDGFYRNPDCLNKFVFQRGQEQVTLLYQPKVDNESAAVTGLQPREGSSHYYAPDYLLCFRRDGQKTRFLIADAKYSSRENIICDQLPELARKYLWDLEPADKENSYIDGLYILTGRGDPPRSAEPAGPARLDTEVVKLAVLKLVPEA